MTRTKIMGLTTTIRITVPMTTSIFMTEIEMINIAVVYLPWLLSVITIYMTVLAGNKSKHAWLVGLGNQLLWLIWIYCSKSWGLLPMNIALWIVYTRNHMKWKST